MGRDIYIIGADLPDRDRAPHPAAVQILNDVSYEIVYQVQEGDALLQALILLAHLWLELKYGFRGFTRHT